MSILKGWPICLLICFWNPKPLKKQKTPYTGVMWGFKAASRHEQFPIILSSLFPRMAGGEKKKKKCPLFSIYWSLEHKNHLTLLHKLLLAPASWIPCPAALCTPGGIKQSTDHLLTAGRLLTHRRAECAYQDAAPPDTNSTMTAGPACEMRPR